MWLRRAFFARSALEVAPDLLGTILVVKCDEGVVAVRLNETEAYTADDPASHSFRGRTPRNASMFGGPGRLYVYFTYGMHWCLNVVTGSVGTGEAVLLRGGTVVTGIDTVRARRTRAGRPVADRDLVNGPAKLCQATAIDRHFDGMDLCAPRSSVRIQHDGAVPRTTQSVRVGISVGTDRPWRFVDAADHSLRT
jgi:DNA-3-methyladenine glycosylase